MALLTAQLIDPDGLNPTMDAADAGGDEAEAGAGVFLVVDNADVGTKTVTVNQPVSYNGVAQYAIAVPAGERRYIPLAARNVAGHTEATRKNTNTNDRAHWTYDDVTSVTVAVMRAK